MAMKIMPFKKEILCDGYYYDVTNWIKRHPGGSVIEYYTESGEDATIAIQQFHRGRGNKVSLIMKSLPKRFPDVREKNTTNLEMSRRNQALTDDFVKLYHELEKEGYFKPSLLHIIYRITEILVLGFLSLYLIGMNNVWMVSLGTLILSLCGGRCGFLIHEGGHNSLTGFSKVDKLISSMLFGVGLGGSASWYSGQHNRHHAMPQRITRDVDLDTMPLLAFNKESVKDPKAGKGFFVQHQELLFLTIDTFLVSILWTCVLHPRYMFRKRKYLEMFFVTLHVIGAVHYVGFVPYLIYTWLKSCYLFGNFALSHSHLPATTDPKHWVEYGLIHTMDVESSWLVSWWMGYLDCQIEHHLFPSMPQFRCPLIRHRVKALAHKHNIEYNVTTYAQAVKKTFQNLRQVSQHFQELPSDEAQSSAFDFQRDDRNNFKITASI